MFVKEKFIRFQHCDPAGIVFYPHYFVLFHELVEDWFNEGIGESYAHFVKHHGMGLPMAMVTAKPKNGSPSSVPIISAERTRSMGSRKIRCMKSRWPAAIDSYERVAS